MDEQTAPCPLCRETGVCAECKGIGILPCVFCDGLGCKECETSGAVVCVPCDGKGRCWRCEGLGQIVPKTRTA
jgi:hypothetical protein